MQRFVKFPLWFLFIGSVLGFILRLQAVYPVAAINYRNLLHGHSHVMFLGWVFNALFIGFATNQIEASRQRPFVWLFLSLQVLTMGMLFSFPLQGYGAASITLSTLHTLLAFIFTWKFVRTTKHDQAASAWFARASLLFFVLSSVGPFSLAYQMARHLGVTPWYHYSVYFYLHFQYNGFFLFGLFSLLLKTLERQGSIAETDFKKTGRLLAWLTVPTYLLSVVFSRPGVLITIVASAAAVGQILLIWPMLKVVRQHERIINKAFSHSTFRILKLAGLAFILKLILQLGSAVPPVAVFVHEFRPLLIAYFHLVLLGVITLGLLATYFPRGFPRLPTAFMLFGFIGMEIILFLAPWWNGLIRWAHFSPEATLLTLATLLALACFGFALTPLSKVDENQDLDQ